MFAERSTLIREKKFSTNPTEFSRRKFHSSATLTDDHTLFLLNQQREKQSKVKNRSWLSKLFSR